MANSAYWFKHDTNAKDDHKVMLLMDQLGIEGYGIFWIIIEVLREQEDYSYPMAMLPVLAKRYYSSAEKFRAVVLNYGLFEVFENDNFSSPSLMKRMGSYDAICEKRRASGSVGGKKKAEKLVANAKQMLSNDVANAKQPCSKPVASRVDKSRVEEIGVDKIESPIRESKVFTKAFLESPFKDESIRFSKWYLDNLAPESITISDKSLEEWAYQWYLLRSTDKRSNVKEMCDAIKWAREDKFWSSHLITPMKLRTKDKNGVMFIDRFIIEMQKSNTNGKQKEGDYSWLMQWIADNPNLK